MSLEVFPVLRFPELLKGIAANCASGRFPKRLLPELFEKMLGVLAEVEVFAEGLDG